MLVCHGWGSYYNHFLAFNRGRELISAVDGMHGDLQINRKSEGVEVGT